MMCWKAATWGMAASMALDIPLVSQVVMLNVVLNVVLVGSTLYLPYELSL